MHNKDIDPNTIGEENNEANKGQVIVKIYSSQDEFTNHRDIEMINDSHNDQNIELKPYKR